MPLPCLNQVDENTQLHDLDRGRRQRNVRSPEEGAHGVQDYTLSTLDSKLWVVSLGRRLLFVSL
jgi:hypothetical protein